MSGVTLSPGGVSQSPCQPAKPVRGVGLVTETSALLLLPKGSSILVDALVDTQLIKHFVEMVH